MQITKQTVEKGQEDKNIYEFINEVEAETTDGKLVMIKKRESIQSLNELEVRKAHLLAELDTINSKLAMIESYDKTKS